MSQVALAVLFLIQGTTLMQGGTVTGVLRDIQNKPVEGVRMAAIARPEGLIDISSGAAMAGITVTDEQGRFTLENIPPGRYVIAAGRLDLQTYYPGTQNVSEATILTITPRSTIQEINFVLNTTSFGRAPGSSGGGWSRLAAYQDIVWPADKPEAPRVLLNGKWYELLSVESLPTKDLIDYARQTFSVQWQKRFDEDMVEVLAGLGRPAAGVVSLGLRNLETDEALTLASPMNSANRSALMHARQIRTSVLQVRSSNNVLPQQ